MGETRTSESAQSIAPRLGTLPQAAIAIIDDDPDISQALGQWVELHGLSGLLWLWQMPAKGADQRPAAPPAPVH